MNPKISVIIPIYETKLYLDSCLNSISNQSFKEIEIICVDDCSPDDSYLTVEEHIAEDPRVNLIRHDKNKGLGGARNTGILAAKSDYIASVDSDDTIKEDMLERLWEETDNKKNDIVCCGYDELNEKGKVLHSRNFKNIDILNLDNDIDIFSALNPSFCNKLWRKSLFVENNIFFPENRFFEDTATTPRVLMKAKKIKCIDKSLYNYYQREQSITSTYTEQHVIDLFHAYSIVLDSLKKSKTVNRYKDSFVEYIESGFRFHSQGVASSNKKQANIDHYLDLLMKHKTSFLEKELSVFTKEINSLSVYQRVGSKTFELFFGYFISPTHLKKLKHHPEFYFRDSKNKFTRFIGSLLRII